MQLLSDVDEIILGKIELGRLVRANIPKIFGHLMSIVCSESGRHNASPARVDAAELLLAYGLGMPEVHVKSESRNTTTHQHVISTSVDLSKQALEASDKLRHLAEVSGARNETRLIDARLPDDDDTES